MSTFTRVFKAKPLIILLVAGVLQSCSSASTLTPSPTDASSAGSETNQDTPKVPESNNDMQTGTPEKQDTPVSAMAAKYEQDIGKNLDASACDLMDNARSLVETDLGAATSKISEILALLQTYKESIDAYIEDPVVLKEFRDNLDSGIRVGNELKVALVSQDFSGLSNVPILIEHIQGADAVARVSLGTPPVFCS